MAYDNICKFLLEHHTAKYLEWILKKEIKREDIQILSSELQVAPTQPDFVAMLSELNEILHLELQTDAGKSNPPIPFRLLDYWVQLTRVHRNIRINQVVVLLKETLAGRELESFFESGNTRHEFSVIRLWEEDPEMFLNTPELLPLAILTKTKDREKLLVEVKRKIEQVDGESFQAELKACSKITAGLYLKKGFIKEILRGEHMRESVIYQEILEEGKLEGREEGRQEGERALLIKLLNKKMGVVPSTIQEELSILPTQKLEDLGEKIFDLDSFEDLETLLKKLEDD